MEPMEPMEPMELMDPLEPTEAELRISDINYNVIAEAPALGRGADRPDRAAAATAGGLLSAVEVLAGAEPAAGAGPRARVRILEQPAARALRFRYACEGRSAGSLPGARSQPQRRTFPAIQVEGWQGRAVALVSCVSREAPHRPHPHAVVGRDGCRHGVCVLPVPPDSMTLAFTNLGVQCVKRRDVDTALRMRERIRVDPFRTGFDHRRQPGSIDLNSVRLCFQVFLEGDTPGKYSVPLAPVVSDAIYDKKATADLVICKLSDCSASVAGGKELILLCEKVAKEDIEVRFFEEEAGTGALLWEALGDFTPAHVHRQVAIALRTPRYRRLDCADAVAAQVQLRRPSDGAVSSPLPFELTPLAPPGRSWLRRLVLEQPQAQAQAPPQPEEGQHEPNQGFVALGADGEPAEVMQVEDAMVVYENQKNALKSAYGSCESPTYSTIDYAEVQNFTFVAAPRLCPGEEEPEPRTEESASELLADALAPAPLLPADLELGCGQPLALHAQLCADGSAFRPVHSASKLLHHFPKRIRLEAPYIEDSLEL